MTAARDYEHDEWIPWYVEDTPGWLELSLAARGAMAEIARKLNRVGELRLRRGISSLAVILRLRWEGELEMAVAELIAAGKVHWDGSTFVLSDPEYLSRKRKGSADRMRELRDRRKRDASDACDVTPVTSEHPEHVTGVTPVLVSSDLISSESDLGSGSDAREPPTWWATTCDTVESVTGAKIDRGSAWLRYSGHRRTNGKRMAPPDAQYWLTTVDVREQKQDRMREQAMQDSAAANRNRRFEGPPKAPEPTPQQAKQFAEQLSQRLLGNRKVGS